MKRSLAILRYVFFGLACVVAAMLFLLWLFERTGILRDLVRDELAKRLGASGSTLAIESAELEWFDSTLRLGQVSFGSQAKTVRLENLSARFSLFGEPSARLESVTIAGGRIELGPELLAAVRALRNSSERPVEVANPATTTPAPTPKIPTIAIRSVQLDLEHPELGELPLGLVDARVAANSNGRIELRGRIVPSLAARETNGEIDLEGLEAFDGHFEVHASTTGVSFAADELPDSPVFAAFRHYAPRGTLVLDARASIDLAHPEPTRGEIRASIAHGAVKFAKDAPELGETGLELDLRLEPHTGETWADPSAWNGAVSFATKLGDAALSGFASIGRDSPSGSLAHGFVHIHDATLDRPTLLALGASKSALDTWDALQFHGRGDLHLALDWRKLDELPFALEIETHGAAGVSFVGWAGEDGLRRGFPWPVEGAQGHVVTVWDPARSRKLTVALMDLFAHGTNPEAGAGPPIVHCDGMIRSSANPKRINEFDLRFSGTGIPVDEHLRAALVGAVGNDWIWQDFAPQNGRADAAVRERFLDDQDYVATSVDAALQDVDLAWSELPLPLLRSRGELHVLIDPKYLAATSFALESSLASADVARIRGRIQDDPDFVDRPHAERSIDCLSIEIDNAALKGTLRDTLTDKSPAIGAALDAFGAVGKIDAKFAIARARAGGLREFECELTPRVVKLYPRAFQIEARNVQGRAIVVGRETAPTTPTGSPGVNVDTRIASLVGDWTNETRVAFSAEFPAQGASNLELAGAGLNMQNRALMGALHQTFATEPGSRGFDLSSLSVDGRVDFRGVMTLPADGSRAQSRYEVRLRENGFQLAGGVPFGLDSLAGMLVQQDDQLFGRDLEARLGRTRVLLKSARFYQQDGRFHLEAEPEVHGLPLDREHMRLFLDPDTIRALEERLHWKGTIDIDAAKLTYVGTSSSDARVDLSASITPHDMSIDIGLPVSIQAAKARIRSLVLEQGNVRAFAEIEGLDGKVAGRKLERAKMLVTYIEPHLSILDLSGMLEGGAITDLGAGIRAGGPAFSVDLREPYGFELGMRLDQVDVAGLLRGLFESDFANTGKLSGALRLAGDLDHLTRIQGRGNIDLSDSRLWSIPVVRDLFAQLGYDKPAVFQRVKSRFEVDKGVIDMTSLYMASPLVQLVGSGQLDLDGRLHHDLEVKYALVDNLGPFTRFVYWVQNHLLRVSVRGDMSRPKVLLRGALSFLQRTQNEKRDLPLPPFTPIPERF